MIPLVQHIPAHEAARRRRLLARRLRDEQAAIGKLRAFVGFDGFVDEIIRVVAARHASDSFRAMETIGELADRIKAAAGLSTNLELVVERTKLGGNGPIMALALARLGVQVTCVGTLGEPDLHPVFHELRKAGVETISLGPPAHTDALEFRDGKLMLGKLQPLQAVRWDAVVAAVGRDRLRELAETCHLVAQLNWTMLPHLNEIWDGWHDEMAHRARGIFFVDFADPAKRPLSDLQAGLASLSRIARHQPVYLGVNWREALAVHAALASGGGPSTHDPDAPPDPRATGPFVESLGPLLAARGLTGVLVHPVRDAAAWRRREGSGDPGGGESAWVWGPYTAAPKLTTGAGDNFNAGAALGLCLGLPLPDVLWLGKATSGYYVRHGESPTLFQLAEFLERGNGWNTHKTSD